MPLSMSRGKNQILYNYLPERTIEFPKGMAIARITQILGSKPQDINHDAVVHRIAIEARAWREDWRPALRDQVLRDPGKFILIDPEAARSELFPKVFWCQNRSCGRVYDYRTSNRVPRQICVKCNKGHLVQLRFVKVHNCGHLEELSPPRCSNCPAGSNEIALDTRDSERMVNFRWVCMKCRKQTSLFGGYCPTCPSTMPSKDRMLDIQLHRAGKTYYPHTTTLLNIPHGQLQGLFSLPMKDWAILVAAKFLELPAMKDVRLSDLGSKPQSMNMGQGGPSVSTDSLLDLTSKMQRGEITAEEMATKIRELTEQAHKRPLSDSSTEELRAKIVSESTVPESVWVEAGYDLLESILPNEAIAGDLADQPTSSSDQGLISRLGMSNLQLLSDFPIITATYGYSRCEYDPNKAQLRPFPPDNRRTGKYPIFVDKIQADAIRIRLDRENLFSWLQANGCQMEGAFGAGEEMPNYGYFVKLFHHADLRSTIQNSSRELRMVFGVMHTLAHLCIRQAALLCGLERTSLSEYILPRSLEFILYCNHREGATIGALTAIYEQNLLEWLTAVLEGNRCVYDPVCAEMSSSCHACTHLAETSCRYFNLNLSRALLFGGQDPVLGHISQGLFGSAI